ncbi:hypothetical protein [Citrobacter portucalensis]|uniref:hypothetical protein n=1 Tax=Citrobacter portucalensis TaxID=1639133 RepID=UPI003B26A454
MITKQLVETIKHNGILASAGELKKLFTKAVEAEEKNIELQQKLTDLAVQLANAESKCRELAAENSCLKISESDLDLMCAEMSEDGWESVLTKPPATDAFLAEVQASARNEGINYAASRLAAAFNHGFVDKPLAEVCDVVRMILDTKEELANSTLPAADGISGEYAEKFLAEFAAQLRKGGAL